MENEILEKLNKIEKDIKVLTDKVNGGFDTNANNLTHFRNEIRDLLKQLQKPTSIGEAAAE